MGLKMVNTSLGKSISLGLVAGCIGWAAWQGNIWGYLLLVFVPYIWQRCTNRLQCFYVLWCYYALAARDIVHAGAYFLGGQLSLAILLWASHAALLAACWTVCWKQSMCGWQFSLRFMIVLGILTIPPIGIIAWANPVTSAGVFFPDTGWLGIGLWFGLVVAIAFRPKILPVICIVSVVCNYIYQPVYLPVGWKVAQTEFGAFTTHYQAQYMRHRELQSFIREWEKGAGRVLFLPESIAGEWNLITEAFWKEFQPKKTVFLGVELEHTPLRYDNALLDLSTGNSIRAAIPMPVGNVNPFAPRSAAMHILNQNVIDVQGKAVLILFCFEEMLVWPLWHSMLGHPVDIIISVSNVWWAKGTSIPDTMGMTTRIWGRLFGIAVGRSTNL